MQPPRKLRRFLLSPYLLLLLPSLFWAGNAVIGRGAVGIVPPFGLSFWRWATALAILLPFTLPRVWAQRALVRRHIAELFALAATSVAAYNTFLYLALQTTTAINATLVASSLPIVIVGLSWLWLGERVTLRQAGGILASMVGVLFVISHGDPAILLEMRLTRGDAWVLAATLAWAAYSVLLRRYLLPFDPFTLLTLLMVIGTPMILPFYLWEMASGIAFDWRWESVLIIGYVALFPSIAAYYLWNQGIATVGANLAGLYSNVVPVFAAVLSTVFLGEYFRWYHLLGLVLIFLGIWLATRPSAR